eukprot:scaffold1334_cov344-Prasinococcus_capsulatus_cf.AAC.2
MERPHRPRARVVRRGLTAAGLAAAAAARPMPAGGAGLRLPLAHLEWHAPFLSGGGYSSEALTFVQGLLLLNRTAADASDAAAADDADEGAARWAPLRLRLEQHGDGVSDHFVAGLDPALVDELVPLFPQGRFASSSSKGAVVVCHSEPGAWAPARLRGCCCGCATVAGAAGARAARRGASSLQDERVPAARRLRRAGAGDRAHDVRDGPRDGGARAALQPDGRGVGALRVPHADLRGERRAPGQAA